MGKIESAPKPVPIPVVPNVAPVPYGQAKPTGSANEATVRTTLKVETRTHLGRMFGGVK